MDIDTARAACALVKAIDAMDGIIAQYNAAIDAKATIVTVRVADPITGRETPLTIPPGIIAAEALGAHVAKLLMQRDAIAGELAAL